MKNKRIIKQTVWTIAFMVTLNCFYSCNSCHQNTKEETKTSYQKIENERYHYSFIIPEGWNALNISDNGDGYFISTSNPDFKIKVYGEMIINNKNQYLSETQKIDEFTFNDGYTGKIYKTSSGEYLISRSDSLIRVNAYLNATNNDNAKLQKQFLKMAKTLIII